MYTPAGVSKRPTSSGSRTSRKQAGIMDVQQRTTSSGKDPIPIRMVLANIDKWLMCDDWVEARNALLQWAVTVSPSPGESFVFGDNVDLDKKARPRERIPVTQETLSTLAAGRTDLPSFIIKHVLPELVNPMRPYQSKDYRLLSAAVFVDPVGSSEQEFHEDLHGMDRHAVWNILIPLQLPVGPTLPIAENFRDRDIRDKVKPQTMTDAVMWDAGWPHRGTGNQTDRDRLQLHLIFAPNWMICGACDNEHLPLGLHQSDVEMCQSEIAREYNFNRSIFDKTSPIGYWVDLIMADAQREKAVAAAIRANSAMGVVQE